MSSLRLRLVSLAGVAVLCLVACSPGSFSSEELISRVQASDAYADQSENVIPCEEISYFGNTDQDSLVPLVCWEWESISAEDANVIAVNTVAAGFESAAIPLVYCQPFPGVVPYLVDHCGGVVAVSGQPSELLFVTTYAEYDNGFIVELGQIYQEVGSITPQQVESGPMPRVQVVVLHNPELLAGS